MLLQPGEPEVMPAGAPEASDRARTADGTGVDAIDWITPPRGPEGPSPDVVVMADFTLAAGRRAFPSTGEDLPAFDPDDLAGRLLVAFRWHPHISNVMTHISGGHWEQVGHALRVILDPGAARDRLSPLARNMVELMWAERGVTGRILKPYLQEFLGGTLPRPAAGHPLDHIARLCGAPDALDQPRAAPVPGTAGLTTDEGLVDVREIDPRVRHAVICQLFERLDETGSLQLIADQDLLPLHLELEAKHRNRCVWTYLGRGPRIWRIRLRRGRREIEP